MSSYIPSYGWLFEVSNNLTTQQYDSCIFILENMNLIVTSTIGLLKKLCVPLKGV